MRLSTVFATVFASTLGLHIMAIPAFQDARSQHDRPWQRPHKSASDQRQRPRVRHAEPDRHRPQRPFRGGRVRHPMFEGSGCPLDSVALVNSSDTSSFALSALFSEFQAQTTRETLHDRRTCVITVALEPEENMSIGVAHVDFRGSAYVPEATSTAVTSALPKRPTHAQLHASYSITGTSHDSIADATYAAGYDDQFYESFDVSEVAWTPCEKTTRVRSRARVFEFRIFATITASKASASDADVAIAVDTSDATLQKGVYYELTMRCCDAASISG